jgi:uncharacterized LabA/DUF88 family protein
MPSYAILMDGAFVRTKLQRTLNRFPAVSDIADEINRLKAIDALAGHSLLRTYFYDAPPAGGSLTNPISGENLNLNDSDQANANRALQQALDLLPDFALRSGETDVNGWTLGRAALKDLKQNGARALKASDLVPKIEQKGVDLRIGLDIARLSIQRMVQAIVVVTGDSDMVPAFKFARREGMRVILSPMGHGIKRELKVHADLVV